MVKWNLEKSTAPLKYGVSKSLKFDLNISEKFKDPQDNEVKLTVPVYSGGHPELLLMLILKWFKIAWTYNMFDDAAKILKMRQMIGRTVDGSQAKK